MDKLHLSSPLPGRRFQFRLATLFVVTTILCLHFGLVADSLSLALVSGAVSTSMATIYIANRRFGMLPALSGACAIIASGLLMGAIFFVVGTTQYLMPRQPSDPGHGLLTLEWIFRGTLLGGLIGLVVGFVISLVYWVAALINPTSHYHSP